MKCSHDELDPTALVADVVVSTFMEVQRKQVTSEDGTVLHTHSVGTGSAGVIVAANAVGMPHTMLMPLAHALAQSYMLITWDSRVLPGDASDGPNVDCSLDAHVSDLGAVLRQYGLECVDAALGWCTGAQVVLAFAAANPQRVRSLVLCCGAYDAEADMPTTAFHRAITELMPCILRKPALSTFCANTLRSKYFSAPPSAAEHGLGALAARVPELWGAVTSPFGSGESLLKYARLIAGLRASPWPHWSDICCPTLVLGAESDEIGDPRACRMVHELLPQSELHVLPDADHYVILESERIEPLLTAFFRQHLVDRVRTENDAGRTAHRTRAAAIA